MPQASQADLRNRYFETLNGYRKRGLMPYHTRQLGGMRDRQSNDCITELSVIANELDSTSLAMILGELNDGEQEKMFRSYWVLSIFGEKVSGTDVKVQKFDEIDRKYKEFRRVEIVEELDIRDRELLLRCLTNSHREIKADSGHEERKSRS